MFNRPEKRNAINLTQPMKSKHGLYFAVSGTLMTVKEAQRIGFISMT